MLNKIVKTIKEHNLIVANSNIIIGFSGGSDSVCLTDILFKIKEQNLLGFNFNLTAIHINHMLRGEESNKDKEFVIKFCEDRNIKIITYDEDIKRLKAEKKQTIEEVAREVRKNRFEGLLNGNNDKIALAHNYSDNAETILMHLFRGSGLNGLLGMDFKENNYIRPLIKTDKADILKYLQDNNLAYRTDKTNFLEIYQRNKVRLSLIPYLEENFNNNIISSLNNTIDILKIDNDFIEQNANYEYNNICVEKKYKNAELILLNIDKLKNVHTAILTRIFIKAYKRVNGSNVDLNSKNLADLKALIYKENGKKIMLSKNIVGFRGYKDIYFYKENEIISDTFNSLIEFEKLNKINNSFYIYIGQSKNFDGLKKVKEKEFYFDNEQNFYVRNRRNGDKIYLDSIKGNKTLKNYFYEEKLDEIFRDSIPILSTELSLIMILDKNLISTDNFNSGNFRYLVQIYKSEVYYE